MPIRVLSDLGDQQDKEARMLMGREATTGLAAGILFMTTAATVASADGGPYVGGSVGRSVLDVDSGTISANAVDGGFASAQTNLDDTDTGWKLFGGFRINEFVALEGHYIDFGKAKFTTRTTGPDGTIDGNADATAYGLDAIAIIPASDRATVFGKLGIFKWEVDGRVAEVINGEPDSRREEEEGTSLKAGIGVTLHLLEQVGVRLEAEHYFDVGDERKIGSAEIFFFSAGITLGF